MYYLHVEVKKNKYPKFRFMSKKLSYVVLQLKGLIAQENL